ncbi:MAG TPA: Uma2 family endonuclease [Isosphaeraceae bacterium]|nr:Uma2 family endonuclease [Isosphaeraceae bacterium]
MNSPHRVTDPPRLLGKADDGRILSSEEFASAEFEEGWVYERVQRRLVVMFPDGEGGIRAMDPWMERLFLYKAAHHQLVQYVVNQAWVRIDDDTDRFPDIAVYLVSEKAPPIPDRVPEIIFEIVSGTRRDRERDYDTKRATYEKIGVREYVIVDRFLPGVLVLENSPNGFRERRLTPADRYETPLLPGFSVPLSEVLSS